MSNGIYPKIKKRIELSDYGTVFVTSDFADLAAITTVRKCLGRQVEEKTIRRIIDGVYEKPVFLLIRKLLYMLLLEIFIGLLLHVGILL